MSFEPVRPVVIIGAPRSGTNMLRDAIASLPGTTTWPCDELNAMWRHGSNDLGHDALPASRAGRARRTVRRSFAAQARRAGAAVVVEKTCANSLRVPYVDAILPEATYVWIVRDGLDATASAMKRWRASTDLAYTLRKVRYTPASDLPHFAVTFTSARLRRWAARDGVLGTWGPVYPGMQEDLRDVPLDVVCAHQWHACVAAAERDLNQLPHRRVVRVTYEDFVASPHEGLRKVTDGLRIDVPDASIRSAVEDVRADSVGRWRKDVTPEEATRLSTVIADLREQAGAGDRTAPDYIRR